MFREIMENGSDLNNRQGVILISRSLIRYITRLFGYSNASIILSKFVYLLRRLFDLNFDNYSLYIFQINIFRNTCFDLFIKGKVSRYMSQKKKWANFVIENSKDINAIENATDYLELVYRYKLYDSKFLKNVKNNNKDTFYIYGPNADSIPLSKYKDSVIVLTKPVDEDISIYKESKLFLNSYYFNKVVLNDKKREDKLREKYDCIYVSCMHAKLNKGFKRLDILKGGNLSSPMALGRVIRRLINEYGRINCVIHGFDFYLSKNAYNSKYPTSVIDKNGVINNQEICTSLIEHDALYNFLYVKKMIEILNIKDSEAFVNIINMTGREYVKKLTDIRNCSSNARV